ncbi:MAG: TonB family protein [Bryobacteraceae bacterium]
MSTWNESAWAALAASAALKSMLVLAAAWLAAKCLGRSSAAARHLLWTVALAAMVAVPMLSLVLPAWRLPFAVVPNVAFNVTASGSLNSPANSAASSSAPVHAVPSATAHGAWRPGWALGLLLLWGAGAAIMLARTLAAGFALSRLGPGAGWQTSANAAARAMGLKRPPRVRESAPGAMPMAFGVFRPAVCLPGDAAGWTEERRRVVLLHELAHIRRGDTVWHAVARFALSVYWWNPLAWTAWRECLQEAERAADDLVLAAGARASDYAALLLDVAREFTTLSAGVPAALAMARRSQLEGRLLAILDARANRQSHPRVAVAIAILAALLVAPFAAVRAQDDAAAARVPADIDATIRAAIEQKNHDLLDEAAKTAEAQRQYDAAQKLLDSSLQIRRQQSGDNSAVYAEGLVQLGDLAGRRKQLDQAAAYYNQAANIFGDKPAASRPLMSLGVTQILQKNYDQAFETFQRADVLDPSRTAMATAWMAVARSRQSDNAEQAETLYRQALALAAPGSADAADISRMLAGFLKTQGRTTEADELISSVSKRIGARPTAKTTTDIHRVGGGVSAPTLIHKVEPEYSPEARAAKYQGQVTLYVEVGPDGLAHNIQVTQGLGLGLDERAVEAVSQWRFKPGMMDGQPVTVAATIQVNFRLL